MKTLLKCYKTQETVSILEILKSIIENYLHQQMLVTPIFSQCMICYLKYFTTMWNTSNFGVKQNVPPLTISKAGL